LRAFFTIAEEEIARRRCRGRDEDVGARRPAPRKLAAIGFAEIEEDIFGRGLWPGHHVEPLDGVGLVAGAEFVKPFGGFGKLGLKTGGDFGATHSSSRRWKADASEEISGLGFELHLHLADGFDDDALERAAPSGVNCCDGALFRIDEENRDTVGGLDGKEKAERLVTEAFRGKVRRVRRRKMDDVGMDLFQRNEFEVRCAEADWKTAAVFEDAFLAIPFGKTEIERFPPFRRLTPPGRVLKRGTARGVLRARGLAGFECRGLAFDPVGADRLEEADKNVCSAEERLRALRLGVSVSWEPQL